MLKIKVIGAWHCVQLISSSKTIFKSICRATAREWKIANDVTPAAYRLNNKIGLDIWRERENEII